MLSLFFLVGATVCAQQPQFTSDGKLMRPENYREWIFLSSGLGMTYGAIGAGATREHPLFDNVFVNPPAYKSFLATGAWPDKTIFILEVRASGSKSSINTGGHYQDEISSVQAAVKDGSRFQGNWGYFGFKQSSEPVAVLPKTAACYECHSKNGAVDNTFVQFYPTLLPVAKAKGTVKK
jgi:hypothetical protein